jgi:hypothetical protein
MGLVGGIWLSVLGFLGAAEAFGQKDRMAAAANNESMIKFQGWFGAISAIWGAWMIISSIMNLGWVSVAPFWWTCFFAAGLCCTALGLLFGVGVLKTFAKNPQAQAGLDATIAKLTPYRSMFGIASVVVGLISISSIIFLR